MGSCTISSHLSGVKNRLYIMGSWTISHCSFLATKTGYFSLEVGPSAVVFVATDTGYLSQTMSFLS